MRFTTTHTQPSAVKRELIPLRQDHVLLLCKMLSHSAHWALVLWRRKAYQRLRLSPMAPIWTFGALVIHHRWLHTCRRGRLTLRRRLDHAGRGTQLRTSSSGKEVATVASVKPRSKPAGDTTCKTDTRVWPRRTSNKLQWADVFCKLHTSYVSSIHTSCMAPRLGYDPWPLVHRLRRRMPHELPEPPVADPKSVAAQLPEGEPAES